MTRAKMITPYEMPRCEATRQERYCSDTAETDFQCTRGATIKIDGHTYCKRHAEQTALRLLMSEGENHDG